ncbi:MAG: SRPBCC domain-containing protein [Methanolobus sp.]|nr:SRPBCC domain-containing protein [Methanolobus sp.]
MTEMSQNENELVIKRIFDAPRELLWKTWTEPEGVMHWWGPKGFTSPTCKIDFRVGGSYLFCMRSPDGQDFWSTGVYREIVPMEKIVATDSFADENGNVVSASYYGMSGEWPLELLVTSRFEEQDSKTKFTLNHSGISGISDTDRTNMEQGWNESFDKLEQYLTEA